MFGKASNESPSLNPNLLMHGRCQKKLRENKGYQEYRLSYLCNELLRSGTANRRWSSSLVSERCSLELAFKAAKALNSRFFPPVRKSLGRCFNDNSNGRWNQLPFPISENKERSFPPNLCVLGKVGLREVRSSLLPGLSARWRVRRSEVSKRGVVRLVVAWLASLLACLLVGWLASSFGLSYSLAAA